MPDWRSLWLLVPLLVVPLAGCIDADEPDIAAGTGDADEADAASAPPVIPPAPKPEATATTGAIEGRVRSATLEPLPGTRVFVQRSDGTGQGPLLTTDAEGRFTVSGMTPGRYVVQGATAHHEQQTAEVSVAAGEVTPVRLILPPLPVIEPYSVPLAFTGFMSFGANVADVRYTNGVQDPNHDVTLDFEVLPADLATLMLRVTWDDPAAVLDFDLWYNVTCSPCEAEHTYAQASGNGEVEVRLDRPDDGWPGMSAANETLWLFAWPGATDSQPASVAYQVPFDVRIEAFYHAPAPEGYTLEDDA